jgi:hypothetical protein
VLSGSNISLRRNGREVLSYRGLRAWDASARELPSRMQVDGSHRIRLTVETRNAVYPIIVDPWIQQQNLPVPPSGHSMFEFPPTDSVSISGNTMVIGAQGDSIAHGGAYILIRDGSGWSVQQKLTAPDAAPINTFGDTVAVYGDTVAIGCSFTDMYGFQPESAPRAI